MDQGNIANAADPVLAADHPGVGTDEGLARNPTMDDASIRAVLGTFRVALKKGSPPPPIEVTLRLRRQDALQQSEVTHPLYLFHGYRMGSH